MSLRKGLALLMVTAFGLGSVLPAAAVTISSTNTTSTAVEARILPGNSTAAQILTQNINATASSTEASKNLTYETLSQVGDVGGNANRSTLATTVAENGQKLYETLQPAFTGGNQTQNWNVVVCETTAAGFTNGQDFFFALPSGWDLNLENGAVAVVSPGKVFTTAVSNGVELSSYVAGDLQEKTSSLRAGIAIHIADAENGGSSSTTTTNRDCFSINLQHENVIAPSTASSTAATANLYLFTNGSTDDNAVATSGIVPLAGSATTTDLTFASSILDSAVTLSLANGNDLVSTFIRAGSSLTISTENRTQTEKIAAGAIQQTQLGTQSTISRYRALTGTTAVPGLVLTEASIGAWNLMNGPSALRPAKTLANGSYAYTAYADTDAENGTYLTVGCENVNGSTVNLAGTPVVTVLGTDIDVDSPAAASAGEASINIYRRTGSLVDPNTVASRVVLTGLTLAALSDSSATTLGTLECRAKIRRRAYASDNGTGLTTTGANNGFVLETLASAEGVTSSADTAVGNKFLTIYTSNGEAATTQIYQKWARSQGVAGTAEGLFTNNDTSDNNGNSAFFSNFTGTTIASASVLNATTALKTVKTATQYGVTVASLPSASTASGDADKLVTITIAENSLTPGLPVTATGVTTSDGPADTVTAVADSSGSVKLSLRSKAGSAITLTAPTLNTTSGNGTLAITATAATITPSFTSTAITTELDGADGYVKRGSNALLEFTETTANTIGFTISNQLANADINGAEVVRFGTTNKYAALVKPGAGSYTLTVDVSGTSVTKAITVPTAPTSITTTSFPPNGKISLADKRSDKGTLLFKAARNTWLDSVRAYTVNASGVVSEAVVTLKNKKTIVSIPAATTDTYACVTSDRQTDCFAL